MMLKSLAALLLIACAGCWGLSDQDDTAAPVVVITSPAGDQVSGTVSFAATVVDDSGVDKVEFWVGQTLLFEDPVSPFEVQWNTVNTPDGPINIRVVGTDIAGNTRSVSKSVTVSNAPE